jgi:hypothetical protein
MPETTDGNKHLEDMKDLEPTMPETTDGKQASRGYSEDLEPTMPETIDGK